MTRRLNADVVIVGAGPAGLAAAMAASVTRDVLLLDDNAAAGGQIWRGETILNVGRWATSLKRGTWRGGFGARVYAGDAASRTLFAESADGALEIRYQDVVLATGARELFLPFQGWTLPGVMGAGGLQAMVKGGLPVAGKRVVVAGSGPLLLAVADYLRGKGAKVLAIAEQAPARAVNGFAWTLARHPGKLLQAVALRARQWGIPYWTDTWPLACAGSEKLESVTLLRKGKRLEMACDTLACGFGLVPNTELAQQMGCAMRDGLVMAGDTQSTSVAHVYAAGELTGIGGVEKSLVEGWIAGYGLAGDDAVADAMPSLRTRRAKTLHFASALNRAFALRAELATLAENDTIVCRCEDVTWGRVRAHSHWREAKLHTRCGMGPCQGRVCGAALGVLRGWQVESIREPIFPVRVATLAAPDSSQGE